MKKGDFQSWWIIVAFVVVAVTATFILLIQSDFFDTFRSSTGCESLGGSCVKNSQVCLDKGGRLFARECKDKSKTCCILGGSVTV